MQNKSILSNTFKAFIIATFLVIEFVGAAYSYYYYHSESVRIVNHHKKFNIDEASLQLRLAQNKSDNLLRFIIFTIAVSITTVVGYEIYQRHFKKMQKSFDDFSNLLNNSIKNNTPLVLDEGLQYLEFISVSNSLNKVLEDMNYSQNYNSLTKLPKRSKFLSEVNTLKSITTKQIIVCYIYFKGYEKIIIKKGFEAADKVVLTFVDEIKNISKETPNSIIGKVSGNGDFLFAFPNIITPSYCIDLVSTKFAKAFEEVIQTSGESIYEQSIGLGFDILNSNSNGTEALSNAYRAALLASEQKDALYFTYSQELREKLQYGVELEQDLKKALEDDILEVFYQGKIGANDDKLKGAEALVRWKRNGKFENTELFIKIAEKTDLIIKLERFVIRKVLKTQRELQNRNIFFPISINISAKHLSTAGFLDFLNKRVKESQIDPKYIEIEIIEREKINEENIAILRKIKESGFSISIDDFGKDYSSLSYIGNLPIDCIKIDKSFIDGLDAKNGQFVNDNSVAIVGGIIKIAKSINKIVVAEGVETIEQIKHLRQLGCDQFQGYYFHKGASPISEFLEVYQTRL